MTHFDTVDFYTDKELVENPYPYFEYLRSQGPIARLPQRNVLAVTGYAEALEIVNDPKTFSSANSATGPIPELPFEPEGDDIQEQLDAHRDEMLATGLVVAKDGKEHADHRSLMMNLFTPTRLKANEEYMWNLTDTLIGNFVDQGHCDLITDYATPFATLVIADLLGIPENDRITFCEKLGPPPGAVGEDVSYEDSQVLGMSFLFEYFGEYLAERRENSKGDILSQFAQAKFPDGSTPEVGDLVWISAFLFGAGQDTTARLLGACLRTLCEIPELQEQVRNDRSLIPAFIDEVVRYDGPVKCAHRLAVKTTTIGGVEIKAGTHIALLYGACNRDPREFEAPDQVILNRPNARKHLGFGRGVHTCAGMPLAKAEVTASLNRILDRMKDIKLSEEHHGQPGKQRFTYEPIYTLRALKNLHIEFTPVS
ncbi:MULTISPECIES: cytochrome P450 [unclassified Ketobacter]|uniref:cytochrome P450 n=1 Tax=unclassified Ketobacter TaxID=2639109 RepID=UPI000C91D697|nr:MULTISPECIES: cytochrome P450 [unclassified Ketobacter]MAR91008.1 cytochrome P450 [Pseudomonadales bacterium]HAG94451.1 cytochrome P450 [Gammaproteobacteria bacterium]RLT90200.1 MAG: cytochrome P450 [Ketobacter sp. GenoA1]RLT93603.1 MAG: cytochrome P450 [Ketobacter sp.]HAU15463.1 cytochrome P450 [Gammaproteobacteria bacterium]|tara:strand:- start:11267 stop:12541 length:1275 start_codon:yes stop_codon:yes gene_type:complete